MRASGRSAVVLVLVVSFGKVVIITATASTVRAVHIPGLGGRAGVETAIHDRRSESVRLRSLHGVAAQRDATEVPALENAMHRAGQLLSPYSAVEGPLGHAPENTGAALLSLTNSGDTVASRGTGRTG